MIPILSRLHVAVEQKLEDWNYPVLKQLQKVLGISYRGVKMFSDEFDASGVWGDIEAEMKNAQRSDPAYIPGISSQQDLRRLWVACRTLKPGVVIETGVGSGASSYAILGALGKNGYGRLCSIDLPPDQSNGDYSPRPMASLPAGKQPGWMVPSYLRIHWTILPDDSKVMLPVMLQSTGGCDLFYHDSEHSFDAMLLEYQTVWPYLSSGGILASDDVHWNKAFWCFSMGMFNVKRAATWRGFGMMRKK